MKLDGAWHTDWVFVPAYNDGDAPYGTWTAESLMATPQWVDREDLSYDVGTAVVNELDGTALYAFGWPAAAPYDGTRMIYCSGNGLPALLTDGIGMVCNMTGGASGGPWFLEFNESAGLGIQSSVNSYKINLISVLMFGPTFGADAQQRYETAQSA
ncbi:MAG: trypsin-like serine peptidase [Acidimicrobiales bacterium]